MSVENGQTSRLEQALSNFDSALSSLETAIDGRLDSQRSIVEAEDEVQRVNADRAELAESLDKSNARASRLENINKEVSRRLVAAMETIRGVVDLKTGK